MDRDIAVKALIASGAWEQADEQFLKTMEETKFTKLVTMAGQPPWLKKDAKEEAGSKDESDSEDEEETDEEKKAMKDKMVQMEAKLKANEAPAKTVEEFIARAPADMQGTLRRAVAADKVAKDSLVASLKANARCKFTDDQLKAKDIDELKVLAELAQVEVDFSGRNAGEGMKVNEENEVPDMPALFTAKK